MHSVPKTFAALALAAFSIAPALAAETVTVPANRTSIVGGYSVGGGLGNGCDSVKVIASISRRPDHGTVATKDLTFVVDKGACKGHRARGVAILYTPDKGYHGPDSLRVSFRPIVRNGWTGGAGGVSVNIIVK